MKGEDLNDTIKDGVGKISEKRSVNQREREERKGVVRKDGRRQCEWN